MDNRRMTQNNTNVRTVEHIIGDIMTVNPFNTKSYIAS